MTTPQRSWRPTSTAAVPWSRVMEATALLCVAAAIALWVWPVRALDASGDRIDGDTPSRAATMSTSGTLASSVSPIGSADSLIADAVSGNLFSASRRAPSVRFVLPGGAETAPPAMVGGPVPADSTMVAGEAASMPRLTGIVTVAGERRALLQLAASDGHATLYRAGDVHAGYRIIRIEADYVVLAHRAGTRTLRLSDRRQDSLEVSRE